MFLLNSCSVISKMLPLIEYHRCELLLWMTLVRYVNPLCREAESDCG